MSIEIAIINVALIENYTHKFFFKMTNDIFKVLQIVGVVEEKNLRQHGTWHKDYKYGENCHWMNQDRELPNLNNYMRPVSPYFRPSSLLPVVVSPHYHRDERRYHELQPKYVR